MLLLFWGEPKGKKGDQEGGDRVAQPIFAFPDCPFRTGLQVRRPFLSREKDRPRMTCSLDYDSSFGEYNYYWILIMILSFSES